MGMNSQCADCRYYHYYLWFYDKGDVRMIHSCLIFEDVNDTCSCSFYEKKKGDECDD